VTSGQFQFPTGGFKGDTPPRFGLGPQAEMIIPLTGYSAGGQAAEFGQFDLCFINAPNATPSNPVTVERLDAQMNVVSSATWPAAAGSPGAEAAAQANCLVTSRVAGDAVTYLRVIGIVGAFIDIQFGVLVPLVLLVLAAAGA
jgi:hypothetical protein